MLLLKWGLLTSIVSPFFAAPKYQKLVWNNTLGMRRTPSSSRIHQDFEFGNLNDLNQSKPWLDTGKLGGFSHPTNIYKILYNMYVYIYIWYIYMESRLQAGPLQLGTRVCTLWLSRLKPFTCCPTTITSHAGLERSWIIFRWRAGGGVLKICVEFWVEMVYC